MDRKEGTSNRTHSSTSETIPKEEQECKEIRTADSSGNREDEDHSKDDEASVLRETNRKETHNKQGRHGGDEAIANQGK